MAFAGVRPRFFAFSFYPVRVHPLGQERRGNGGTPYETPPLVRVLHKFSDDKRREYPCRLYPMANSV
jgi:hypothetical protein